MKNVRERAFKADELKEFINYLFDNAKGRSNAKKARSIALDLGYTLTGTDPATTAGECRKIRAMAHNAIVAHGLPLCTDNKGYFIAVNRSEADDALFRLRKVSESIVKRHEALTNALRGIA